MKFNDSGNKHNSLVHYIWYLLGGITITDLPLEDIARATNTAKYNLALKIWKNQDDWDFDDGGHTDFPISEGDLVNGQQDYTLPTGALEIKRVEVKDNNGNYTVLKKIDETEIPQALEEFKETDGLPTHYRLVANSIFFYPAPATAYVTLTDGFLITHNREINEFTASTTTTEVGFGGAGDQITAYEVAEEWAGIHSKKKLANLQNKRLELETNFLAHISRRSGGKTPKLGVVFDEDAE